MNGDGYSDIIVGAVSYDNGQTDEGKAYVFYGTASGVSPTAAWTGEGNQASAQYGYSVGTAGDVDADGYADIIVGANLYDNGTIDRGRAFVYRGSAAGIQATPVWIKDGAMIGDGFGFSVGTAGDVNGDGYADIVVGAPLADNPVAGLVDEGRAYVFLGSSSGPSTTSSWMGMGAQGDAGYGRCVGTAGDVDGDGLADVIVSAFGYDNGEVDEGKVFVYQGSRDGLPTSASWSVEMNQAGACFGSSVATAGDVNGDGFSDVVIGSLYYDAPLLNEGAAWVYNGAAQGLAADPNWTHYGDREYAMFGQAVRCAGDVDGDGYSDIIVGSPMRDAATPDYGRVFLFRGSRDGSSGVPDWTATGEQQLDFFGSEVSGAGDVNGDGYSDVIIGAFAYNPTGLARTGKVYVYHGSPTGLSPTPSWFMTGEPGTSYLGRSVSTAGDVNGDGYSDVIVGAPNAGGGGKAYLYLGSPEGLSTLPAWQIAGANGESLGNSVSTAGDVNGDGYSDVIVGAPGTGLSPQGPGRACVYLGSITGLATTPVWTGSLGQTADWYGFSVSTAGDVNGDGYDDIIVGAELYEQSGYPSNSGAVAVYLGSASGVQESIHWFAWGSQLNAYMGNEVGTAGDVNGDGYSDITFGAFMMTVAVQAEGEVWVKLGSPSGLVGFPEWTAVGDEGAAYFGSSVASAGDVNGDGYDDLVAGAPAHDADGINFVGTAYTYLGNGRTVSNPGPALLPRQLKIGDAPLDWLGMSDAIDQFRLRAEGRSAAGRCRVRLDWNVAELGTPLSSVPIRRGAWHGTSVPFPGIGSSVPLTEYVSSLAEGTDYHWRLRVASNSPFFPHTPWMSMAQSVPSEKQLRTGGQSSNVAGDGFAAASAVRLNVVRPNPFTQHVAIVFELPRAGFVKLSIFDSSGRRVRALIDENLSLRAPHGPLGRPE